MRKLLKHRKKMSRLIFKFDLKTFFHFFVVFTIIFGALTLIILQTLTTGIYKTTDETIGRLSKNPLVLLSLASRDNSDSSSLYQVDNFDDPILSDSPSVAPNQTVVLYDKNGRVLNAKSDITSTTLSSNLKFSKANLSKITTVTMKTATGETLLYRTRLFKVSFDKRITTNITYIQLFVNVNQLSESLARSQFIIMTTMISFWLISLFASIYLAHWSQKPVLIAYEKQKNFVENASHELRTPLAILQNRLELLFQRPTATIIDQSENISQSLAEVRNMRILTSNLLNLAKRDDGLKVELSDVDHTYFEAIFENYQLLAENSQKQFSSNVVLKGSVKLDEGLIRQVLTILFDNAVKYSDPDSVITMTVDKIGQNLTITTADNGFGISDDDKKKIFDRFYRVDKARTRQKGGFGLGLSLAKQIIDACGGKLEVQDNQPKGTKFIIKLKV